MGSPNPTKEDLLIDYLKNKILCGTLSGDDIPTVDDAYFKSPDQLRLCAKQGSDNEWYFYTIRPNCMFVTDDGFYSVFTAEDVLNSQNEPVGFMRILSYYQGLLRTGKKTNWIIQEFSVNPAIIPSSQPDAKTQAKNFIVCKLTWIEGDKSSNDPTYTMRKRKRMQAGRDKDEETYKKKRGRAAPFILENTVSGAPECLALNLKAVLFNCEALGLDFGSQIEEQSHEIVALCKICMLPKIIQVNLFSRRRDIGTCDNCRQVYCVDIIAPGRELGMEDSVNGKEVPIMYLRTWNLRTFVFKLRDTKWNVSLAGNRSVKITLRDCHRMEFVSETLLGVNSFYYRYADCSEFTISHMRVIFTQINGLGAGA